ncbi:MAG TPA: head-tail adaptor protein [Mycobacterium sp.]|nr:head-tail adaptor protein [Mycobacterium sp.]
MRRDPTKYLRAGDLSHRLTLEAPAGTIGAEASNIDEHVPAAITVVPVNFQTTEGLAAGGLQTATRYTVSVRYRTDISPAYVWREECCTQRRFQIVSIVPSDRRDAVDMTCVTAG